MEKIVSTTVEKGYEGFIRSLYDKAIPKEDTYINMRDISTQIEFIKVQFSKHVDAEVASIESLYDFFLMTARKDDKVFLCVTDGDPETTIMFESAYPLTGVNFSPLGDAITLITDAQLLGESEESKDVLAYIIYKDKNLFHIIDHYSAKSYDVKYLLDFYKHKDSEYVNIRAEKEDGKIVTIISNQNVEPVDYFYLSDLFGDKKYNELGPCGPDMFLLSDPDSVEDKGAISSEDKMIVKLIKDNENKIMLTHVTTLKEGFTKTSVDDPDNYNLVNITEDYAIYYNKESKLKYLTFADGEEKDLSDLISDKTIVFRVIQGADMYYTADANDESQKFKLCLIYFDKEKNEMLREYHDLLTVPNDISISKDYRRINNKFIMQGYQHNICYFELAGHLHKYTTMYIDVDEKDIDKVKQVLVAEVLGVDPDDATPINYFENQVQLDVSRREVEKIDGSGTISFHTVAISHLTNIDDKENKNAILDKDIKQLSISEFGEYMLISKDTGTYNIKLEKLSLEEIQMRNQKLEGEEYGE